MTRSDRRRVFAGWLAALITIIIGLWVFAKLAEAVGTDSTLVRLDTELANALYEMATPLSTSVFTIITVVGSPGGFILVALVAAGAAARRRWRTALLLTATYAGAEGLNALLKLVFQRPRPVFLNPIATATHYSFPSGHAMVSLVAYGMLAYVLVRAVRRRLARILIIFATVLLVVLVGLSRMYLGLHYFSDVIGGYLAGMMWLIVCIVAANAGSPSYNKP